MSKKFNDRFLASKGKYAWTVKVGEKGQIVIPKEARELFHIQPGDNLILLADEIQGIAIPPKSFMNGLMGRVFGEPGEEEEQ